MRRPLLVALGILALACAVVVAIATLRMRGPAAEDAVPSEPSAALEEGLAIYADGAYGFTAFYPEDAVISYEFDAAYLLGASWRANALPGEFGEPLLQIVPYEIRQDAGYPRSFAAVVRIGASRDPRELARCEEADASIGEAALPDRAINGTTWKAFSFGDAAMMRYVEGVSYRTVRDGACIALERARTGSSYREEPAASDVPEAELDAAYAALDRIVASVSFGD